MYLLIPDTLLKHIVKGIGTIPFVAVTPIYSQEIYLIYFPCYMYTNNNNKKKNKNNNSNINSWDIIKV